MVHCPQCEYANPERALLCEQCGEFLTAGLAVGRELPKVHSVVAVSSAIEVWPSDEVRIEDHPDETPPPRDAGMPVARPTAPMPPMTPMTANEPAAQAVHPTIPATDRADKPPLPPPEHAVRPRLVVLRGMKIGAEYPIYEGRNTAGRFADKPVDIDLISQESADQIWCSRRHAVFTLDGSAVSVEDLNSLNGTWVNGARIHAGQPRQLQPGDVVQIGTVQMKLVVG
jgi:hypothetical protein